MVSPRGVKASNVLLIIAESIPIRQLRGVQRLGYTCHRMTEPNPSLEPAVEFDDVTCRIGTRVVLEHVTLTIPRGSVAGILGANGAGKTTLLGAVSGLRPAVSGIVTVLGEPQPGSGQKLRRRIGVVFQETALHDELTTTENLDFAASLYDIENPKQRIGEVLDLLGLTDRARERVGRLSGGLRRRVALARALLHDPELLIIDEPTLGVDVEARHTLWAHLRLLRAGGTTVIVSTNYLDEALALCDTVSVLRGGRVLVTDTPAALVARAGSGLDVECSPEAGADIARALTGVPGVLRVTPTPSGITAFLSGDAIPEEIIKQVLAAATIQGVRLRGADLAEVFHALGEDAA